MAPVSSLRRKRFRAISEQRTRDETAHKIEGVKEREGGGQRKKKWTSGPCRGGGEGVGSASVAPPLPMGLTLN